MKRLSPRKQQQARIFDMVARPLWAMFGRMIAPRQGPQADVQSVLVVELWRLGDFALLTPALGALRRRFPAARIALLAPPAAEELLRESGLVDEVIPIVMPWTAEEGKYALGRYDRRKLWQRFRALRARRFDVALSARMDLRDNLVMALAGVRRRVGFDYGGGAYMLTDALPPGDGHRAEDWLALTTHLGAPAGDGALTLRVSEEEQAWASQWLAERGIGTGDILAGIHPGASAAVRRWQADRFATVAQRAIASGARALIFEPHQPGASAWPDGSVLAPATSLRQFMALLERCDVVVCNDSGPMHIAAALGVATVSVFTAQRPDWYAPQGREHAFAIVPGFACRPCFDACVFSEPYCNSTLGVERVLPLVDQALARVTASRG